MIAATLSEYYERATDAGCQDLLAYQRQHDIDAGTAIAHAGVMAVLPCRFDGNGCFDFADDGEKACVIEVYAEDGATTVDLCASPLNAPERFATALKAAPVLGLLQSVNPSSWAFGSLLRTHRTPLGWLQSGCEGGCVILDNRTAPRWFQNVPGPICAEDAAHARELKRLLCRPMIDPANIVYPRHAARMAA